jgi:hypothetical protein
VQLTEAIDGLLSAEPFVWAPTATWVSLFVIHRRITEIEKSKIAWSIWY